MSSTVHRPGIYYKHRKQANSPPLQDKGNIAWLNIVSELKRLAEILDPKNQTTEDLLDYDLFFSSIINTNAWPSD